MPHSCKKNANLQGCKTKICHKSAKIGHCSISIGSQWTTQWRAWKSQVLCVYSTIVSSIHWLTTPCKIDLWFKIIDESCTMGIQTTVETSNKNVTYDFRCGVAQFGRPADPPRQPSDAFEAGDVELRHLLLPSSEACLHSSPSRCGGTGAPTSFRSPHCWWPPHCPS